MTRSRISSCRRSLRDQKAGLVFRWRVGRGSLRRTAVAVVVSLGVVAAAGALFQVESSNVRLTHRETIRITILTPGYESSRASLEWARQKSPHLDRWNPEVESALGEQMALIDERLLERSRYEPLLRLSPRVRRELPVPEFFDPARPRLPKVKRQMARETAPKPVAVRVFAVAQDALESRWRRQVAALRDLLPDPAVSPSEFLGLERRFWISVDPSGTIGSCQVLNPRSSELDPTLMRWLRRQKMEPGGDRLAWGEIRVTIDAVLEPEQEEAP